MYPSPLFRSGLLGWPRMATLATICLASQLSLPPSARAEEAAPQAPVAKGEKPRQEVTEVLGSKQWLSDASCVSCHFQVPKQTVHRSLEAVEKGLRVKLFDLAKAKTGQKCADCHAAATVHEGRCTRGEACLRDAGNQRRVTYLGVSVGAVPQAVRQHVKLSRGVGLMIESVEPGSPAAEAHLGVYDILEKFDQQILVNQEQFSALIKTDQPGDEVALQLIRVSEPKTVRVKLGERIVDDSSATETAHGALLVEKAALANVQLAFAEELALRDQEKAGQGDRQNAVTYLGINTSSPPDALAEQLKLPKGLYLLIDSIEPASPAAAAGLRAFDVLEKLDDQVLVNSEQLTVLVHNHRAGDEVELTLLREGQPLKVRATLDEHPLAGAVAGKGEVIVDFDNDGQLDVMLVNDKLSEAIDLSTRGDVKDEEFALRVYEDLVGTPPPANEMSFFKMDARPNKRQVLIDALLSRSDVIDRIGTSDVLHWSDEEHSLVLTTIEGDHKRLLAKDRQGKVVFNGLVDSDDERRQLDPRLAAKLDLMVKGLAAAPAAGSPVDAGAALEKVVSRFEAHEQTLDQLLVLLRRETGANIVVDRKALAAAGVKLEEPLSLDLHDVRARTVLKTLLALAGGPNARLKYESDDGVVLITAGR